MNYTNGLITRSGENIFMGLILQSGNNKHSKKSLKNQHNRFL